MAQPLARPRGAL